MNKNENNGQYLAYFRNIGSVLRNLFVTSARPLAYTSEVGESFRPLIPNWSVRTLYGISIGYVLVDTGIKTYDVKHLGQKQMIIKGGDTLLWHTFASMILPAVTIHTIVKSSSTVLTRFNTLNRFPKVGKFLPTIIGLGSIPFIIHPLDHITDFVMDKTIRPLYKNK